MGQKEGSLFIMSNAKNGDTVQVHVMAKLTDGTVLNSTINRKPLQLNIGDGKFIRGLEEAIVGMIKGDKKTAKVPAEHAFGPYREGLKFKVDRKCIQPDSNLEVGKQMEMSRGNGALIKGKIIEINETLVILDGNHPLAGKDLVVEIELLHIIPN